MTTSQDVELAPEDMRQVQSVPGQIVAAWAAHDADAFAGVFAEDGTMVLPGQDVRRGQGEIAGFMSAAFQGPYQGTQVVGDPIHLQVLSPEAAVIVSRGGVRAAEATELTPDQVVNATWVVVKKGGDWKLAAYHNSPAA